MKLNQFDRVVYKYTSCIVVHVIKHLGVTFYDLMSHDHTSYFELVMESDVDLHPYPDIGAAIEADILEGNYNRAMQGI